jgi:hypothetical protein
MNNRHEVARMPVVASPALLLVRLRYNVAGKPVIRVQDPGNLLRLLTETSMGLRTRRRILQAALCGAGAWAWPWGKVSAQGEALRSPRAPKRALVIGNSRYRDAPLRNPANDAGAMAAVLKSTGFEVALHLDLTQAAMREAMRAFGAGLAASKAVGLFYFAGHGAQLGWRNYLIPVDAEIADVNELRERAVDLNSLIESIRQAGNPMNMLILDACRDNPFGGRARLEQKGLSQVDAPPGTLLAYATAPGNTAIDGDGGEHGLYTEHLLREIRVPEAKVEDVFKRVRLGVRRRSRGQQIPWESTSLEEDFWFIPPAAVLRLEREQEEREFRQELALWEKIRSADQPEPLEAYLRQYPNGRFAELAQSRLDQVLARLGEKKVEVISAPDNPYTKGSVRTDTAYRVGDIYVMLVQDLLTRQEIRRGKNLVTEITETEVRFNGGRYSTDLLGNPLRAINGGIISPNQVIPAEFAVGKRWRSRYRVTPPGGGMTMVDVELQIVARETVEVPAGRFNAYRVEAQGWQSGANNAGQSINRQLEWKRWYAPDRVRWPVLGEVIQRNQAGQILLAERSELLEYRQS